MDKLIITGAGKSGTHYAHDYFSALGMKMGHESVFSIYGMQPWGDFEGDCSFVAAGEPQDIDETDYVLHLTRDPLASVRTWMNNWHRDGSFWALGPYHPVVGPHVAYFRRKVPEVYRYPNTLSRCIRYIELWNQKCELVSDQRLKVEEISLGKILEIRERFRLSATIEPTTGKTSGSVDGHRFDWLTWDVIKDHPDGEILVGVANRYGYEVES